MRADEIHELAAGIAFRAHGKVQVRPVEAVDEDRGRPREKPALDIAARGRIGRRGQRHDLDAGRVFRLAQLGGEISQREIFGAEIVPPLRDAMRFVDGEQADARLAQHRLGAVEREPLGRGVKQAQAAVGDGIEQRRRFLAAVRGIERACRDAEALQLRDLVAHQRDQRRNHDGQPIAQQSGQLIAQRLAAARRHHGEHVLAFEDSADNLVLARPEIRKPEGLAQRFPCLVQVAHARDLHDVRPRLKGGIAAAHRRTNFAITFAGKKNGVHSNQDDLV